MNDYTNVATCKHTCILNIFCINTWPYQLHCDLKMHVGKDMISDQFNVERSKYIISIPRISSVEFFSSLLYHLLCACAFSYIFESFSFTVVYHFSPLKTLNRQTILMVIITTDTTTLVTTAVCSRSGNIGNGVAAATRCREFLLSDGDIYIWSGYIVILSFIFGSLFWIKCCCLVTIMHKFTRIINIYFFKVYGTQAKSKSNLTFLNRTLWMMISFY